MVTGSTHGVLIHRMSWAGIAMAVSRACWCFTARWLRKSTSLAARCARRGVAGLPAQPSSWSGRVWVKSETSLFGNRIDQKLLALTERSKIANYSVQIVAYVLPFFLGLAAALTGGWAMKAVQASGGKLRGQHAGGLRDDDRRLAAVVAGCMMVSLYVRPLIPSLSGT